MKTNLLKISVLFMMVLSFGCSKDGVAGVNGKDGINGVAGPTGPAGANGNAGANGANGNANVLGSLPFSTASTNWSSLSGGAIWTAKVEATAITQSIVDRGIVSVFRKYTSNDGATEWSPLPDTNTNINISFDYGVGYITLFTQSTNAVAITNPGVLTFRYVIITASNRMAKPNVNWNNYNEVKKALKLVD